MIEQDDQTPTRRTPREGVAEEPYQQFRAAVLVEVLKLITDKVIEVDGKRLEITTCFSELRPELEEFRPVAPHNDDGLTRAHFDTNSPWGTEFPTLYGWQIRLTDT